MTTDLLERIGGDLKRYEQEREANRARFPFAMSLIDPVRAAGLEPKLKHAVNAKGEEIGRPVALPGIAVDGDKLAHLPAFEASWRKFYGKHADSRQAYNERAQRAIKPNMFRGTE
jgi:hypothetical protein